MPRSAFVARCAGALLMTFATIVLANGHSLRFFGTGSGDVDRIKIPLELGGGSSPVNVGGDFTVEFWLKAQPGDNAGTVDGAVGDGWITGNIVVDRDVFGSGDRGDFGVSLGAGRVAFGVAVGTAAKTIVGTTAIDDGAWHHVAATRRAATGELAVYVDGIRDAHAPTGPTGDLSYRVGRPTSYPASDPYLVIGAEKHDAGAQYPSFRGWLDELRISSVVRYGGAFARPARPFVPDPATVALLHLDDGGGVTTHDASTFSGALADGALNRGGPQAGPAWSIDTPFTASLADLEFRSWIPGTGGTVDIVYPPDDSDRVFLVRQSGTVVIAENRVVLPTPFLNLGAAVLTGGERGLLSLAFHPDYVANGRLYVLYTRAPDGALTLARYLRSAVDPRLVDPASGTVLLAIPHSENANHNGGKLLFGDDGYLYWSTGDGGGANDQPNNAQNLGLLLGKLLRIDVDGGSPYAVPPDNPFVGTPGASPEIFAYGLRNAWRWSFDRVTGDLFIGDVGQDRLEEIDLLPATTGGGQNFGWRVFEGSRCNTPRVTTAECAALTSVPPILEYQHGTEAGTGFCTSVTGGFRYRGNDVPALRARYVFADYCTGRIWTAWLDDGGAWQRSVLVDSLTQIATFGEDARGELVYAAATGELRRFDRRRQVQLARRAFDADANDDLLVRSTAGATALRLMSGGPPGVESALLGDAAWRVTHVADFDGNGKADLVWRNDGLGATVLWLMDGAARTGAAWLLVDGAWRVTHVGDFNGDGRADLVWYNATLGATAIWLMSGTSRLAGQWLPAGSSWQVAHVGDLDGDGRSDLVWRHAVSGATAVWLMNGATAAATAFLASDPSWVVTAVADLDGDRRSDLLWRNTATGVTSAWLMNGTGRTEDASLLADLAWQVEATADFDGDGRADLLWRNNVNGASAIWLMDGLVRRAIGWLGASPSLTFAPAGDANGDRHADLLVRNASTGATSLWLMAGARVIGTATLDATGTRNFFGP